MKKKFKHAVLPGESTAISHQSVQVTKCGEINLTELKSETPQKTATC